MDDAVRAVEKAHLKERGDLSPGDIVRIHERIKAATECLDKANRDIVLAPTTA